MFDPSTFILGIRPDLRRMFPEGMANRREHLMSWLVHTGSSEYAFVLDDERLLHELSSSGYGTAGMLTRLQDIIWSQRPDIQEAFPLPGKYPEFQQWFYTHGLEEHRFWHFLAPEEQRMVKGFGEPWASRLKKCIKNAGPAPRRIPLSKREFGVNVIGYAYGQLGIGEDARMAARSLEAAGIPMVMVNFPPGNDVPQNDLSMRAHVRESGKFAINLFCMTAEEHGRFFVERGRADIQDRYAIGYWPWELGKWPAFWKQSLDLVDEVWVSTQHTFNALKPVCNKPLFLMPMAVEVGEQRKFASREAARRYFSLPEKAKLFCFAFDLRSHSARKNPEGCIEAFLRAFPRNGLRSTDKAKVVSDNVGLVIKVSKPTGKNAAWDKLKARAAMDSRIHLIEQTLPRQDVLALYRACDCFLSLHRAEGFGRGLAEALQLGLHVICTGYSGNVDFCKAPHADLVRYELVKLRKADYVHASGQVWAEPNLDHAAALMQAFARRARASRRNRWSQFSAAVVGKGYKKRLMEIQRLVQNGSIPLAGNLL